MISALRRRRWSLAWLLLIVALAAVLAWLASVPLLRGEPDGRIGSRVGEPAPSLALDDLDGRRWSLADADGRLVWVNFWAISCEPCRTEMPAMQRLADAYPDELLILGVDFGEERGDVADFVARYGIEYPVLLDPGLETFYRWASTDGLPRHYFIGAKGTVLREIVGPLDPARMVAILEDLLTAP
jgi:cytochrome c biogenesis protein CcmG, thiol:disulfide interchange protein DsbE